jgi:hypothetical protein
MFPSGRTSHRVLLLVVPIVALGGVAACSGSAGSSSGSASAPATTQGASPPASAGASATASTPTRQPARTVAPVPVESNPPGDIPDNLAFVRYTNRTGSYSFTHPEGWARTGSGARVRFTDKLNGVTVDSLAATRVPTMSSARTLDVPRLQGSVPAFQLRSVSVVRLPAGRGVHLVFRRNSAPDSVTGKVYRDEVEEYDVFGHGRLVRMDLYGPVGADNVDAYRTMSQSLRIR